MMNETPNNMIEYEQRMRLMEKTISQHLSEKDAKDWHVQFAEKIKTVTNFEAFYHNFMIGVLEIALPHDKHGVVQPVIDLHRDYKNVTREDWRKAMDAARDAARVSTKAEHLVRDVFCFAIVLPGIFAAGLAMHGESWAQVWFAAMLAAGYALVRLNNTISAVQYAAWTAEAAADQESLASRRKLWEECGELTGYCLDIFKASESAANAAAFSFWRGSKARDAARGDAWQKFKDAFLQAYGGE